MVRKVRVATVSMAQEFRKARKRKDNLNYVAKKVKEISLFKPDIIALPEVFPLAGLMEEEEILGPGKELFLDLAKRYRVHLVGSLFEEREGNLYNTGLVANKEGEVVGYYDKMHPFRKEIEKGVIPGKKDQLPIETEFGKIGIQICFDANWPEGWQKQVANGAELIIFPSAFPGGRILESIALLNQVYIVSAVWSLNSGIIDNTGRWLVKTDRFAWSVWSTVDLDRTVFHWDFQEEKIKEIGRKYGNKIKVESFGLEHLFALEPNSSEISIPKVIREYGLITYREYIKQATVAQNNVK